MWLEQDLNPGLFLKLTPLITKLDYTAYTGHTALCQPGDSALQAHPVTTIL